MCCVKIKLMVCNIKYSSAIESKSLCRRKKQEKITAEGFPPFKGFLFFFDSITPRKQKIAIRSWRTTFARKTIKRSVVGARISSAEVHARQFSRAGTKVRQLEFWFIQWQKTLGKIQFHRSYLFRRVNPASCAGSLVRGVGSPAVMLIHMVILSANCRPSTSMWSHLSAPTATNLKSHR